MTVSFPSIFVLLNYLLMILTKLYMSNVNPREVGMKLWIFVYHDSTMGIRLPVISSHTVFVLVLFWVWKALVVPEQKKFTAWYVGWRSLHRSWRSPTFILIDETRKCFSGVTSCPIWIKITVIITISWFMWSDLIVYLCGYILLTYSHLIFMFSRNRNI